MKKLAKKAKKQPGRPPLANGLARTKRLDDVRFCPDELTALKQRAAKDGVSWSEWVRAKLSA